MYKLITRSKRSGDLFVFVFDCLFVCFRFPRRAIAQRCPSPPMLNLISFGGQHQGKKKKKIKNCRGGQPYHKLEGVTIL